MKFEPHAALHCYAGWGTDAAETRGCSSGGAAYLISRHFLLQRKGIVYASAFGGEGRVSVQRITTLSELERTKGSKYVNSFFGRETRSSLRRDLEAGRDVLFIGTPCQVAGLRSGSEPSRKGHLILVDLLCHGVPPESYLREEIRYLVGSRPFTDIRFRDGHPSDFHLSIWDQGDCLYSAEVKKQPYLLAALQGVTLMEGCYDCPFARPERYGDITLGDYIGLGAADGFHVAGQRVSYISVNTSAGEDIYTAFLQDSPAFQSLERPREERMAYRPSLLEPTRRSSLREDFLRRLPRQGFARSVRRSMRLELIRQSSLYRYLHRGASKLKSSIKNLFVSK